MKRCVRSRVRIGHRRRDYRFIVKQQIDRRIATKPARYLLPIKQFVNDTFVIN